MLDLETRVRRLETSARRWKGAAMILGSILAVSVFCGAEQQSPSGDLDLTGKLRILNKEGKPLVTLRGTDSGNGEIIVADQKGDERIALKFMPYDKHSLPVMTMLSEQGERSVSVGVDQDGYGSMDLTGTNSQNRSGCGVNLTSSNQGAVMSVKNQNGRNVVVLSAVQPSGAVRTYNDQGKVTGRVGE